MKAELLKPLVEAGKTTREMAAELGASQSNVRYWLAKHGLITVHTKFGVTGRNCLHCSKSLPINISRITRSYCDAKCHQAAMLSARIKAWLESGCFHHNATIRKMLVQIDGDKCNVCGISEWCGKKLSLEVDHKDGNSDDSSYANVRLICPNCHSQTDTYKAKNKGNGRAHRRKAAMLP